MDPVPRPVLRDRAATNWLGLYPRYIAALNWVNLPAMIVAVIGVVVAIVMPLPGELIRVGLPGLFFYWFLVTARIVLGVTWPIAGLLLIVNWVQSLFLSLIVDRYLGVAVAIALRVEHLHQAEPVRRRRRAWRACRRGLGGERRLDVAAGPLAASDEMQRSDHDAHLIVQEGAQPTSTWISSPWRVTFNRSSVFRAEGDWQAVSGSC